MKSKSEETKIEYEIIIRYEEAKVHYFGIAIFNKHGEMIATEGVSVDQNGRENFKRTAHHELSYWQKSVSIENFVAQFNGKIAG